jgi:hypothetical protein
MKEVHLKWAGNLLIGSFFYLSFFLSEANAFKTSANLIFKTPTVAFNEAAR